jgi:hypothetical protein
MKTLLLIALTAPLSVLAAGFLEFAEPADNARFVEGAEVPLVLRASLPDGFISSADVFIDGRLLGTALYCCRLCRCAPIVNGATNELRLPAPLDGGTADGVWTGIRDLAPGTYRLTAVATDGTGKLPEARAVTVTVLPADGFRLRVQQGDEGLLLFTLPMGSMLDVGFDMWISHDLVEWRRLGPFEPGNVAAFFRDRPDPADSRPRYYRALPATPEAGAARP